MAGLHHDQRCYINLPLSYLVWSVPRRSQLLFFSNPKEALSGSVCEVNHCIVCLPLCTTLHTSCLFFFFYPRNGSVGTQASPIVSPYLWESRWQSPASCLTTLRYLGSGRARILLSYRENKCHVQRKSFWLVSILLHETETMLAISDRGLILEIRCL